MAKPQLWWITAHTNQSRTSGGKKGIEKEAKTKIQAGLVDTDFEKLYGSACSKANYAKHHLNEGLEIKQEAELRKKKHRSRVSLDLTG